MRRKELCKGATRSPDRVEEGLEDIGVNGELFYRVGNRGGRAGVKGLQVIRADPVMICDHDLRSSSFLKVGAHHLPKGRSTTTCVTSTSDAATGIPWN